MKRDFDDAPDVAGRFKIALAAVAAGLLVAALGSPIDWTPVAAREARAIDDAPPTLRYEHAAPVDAVGEPHVQAF
jgi:hypothetical protein